MHCAKYSSATILFCVCVLAVCAPVAAQVFDEGEVAFGKLAIFNYGKEAGTKIHVVIDDSLKLTLDASTTVHVVTLPKGLHKIRATGRTQSDHARVFIQANRVFCIDVKNATVNQRIPIRDKSVRSTGRTVMTIRRYPIEITKDKDYLTEDKFGIKLSDLPYNPTLKKVNGMQCKMPKEPEPVTESSVVILVYPDAKGYIRNLGGIDSQYRSAVLTLWRGKKDRYKTMARSVHKERTVFGRAYPGVYRAVLRCSLTQRRTSKSRWDYSAEEDTVEFVLKIGAKEWHIVYVEWTGKGTLCYKLLDHPQVHLLNDIRKHGASSLSERTERLKMQAIQVNQALASLTRNGFVEKALIHVGRENGGRSPSTAQGLRLTQKGKAIAKELW